MIDPMLSWQCNSILFKVAVIHIIVIPSVFFMAVSMILVMYVILCILSYDFNKLTMLYIDVHISLITVTNKSGLTFFQSIKYLSGCLSWFRHRVWYIIKLQYQSAEVPGA